MVAQRPQLGMVEACDRGVFHVEQPGGRGVGPIRLVPVQRDFLTAVIDTYDAAGYRRFRQAAYSVVKKFGKTTTAALTGTWHLLFDDTESNREIYSLAGDMDQAAIALELGKRIIRGSPTLAPLVDRQLFLNKREIAYEDERGGVHIWRAMASDSPTAHGLNPSLVLVDEGWQLRDYELLEAVSLGPQRRHPLQLWTTYAGMKAQMVEGNPLFDLYRRGLAGTDPRLHMLWLSGQHAYDALPLGFIRDGYLEEQRQLLPPNRFKRLHLNEWGGADATFLTEEEIARAKDDGFIVPERSQQSTVLCVDYGRSFDHTALLAARPTKDGRSEVVNALAIKGSRVNPVPIDVVEAQILDWVSRYRVERVHLDPFQMIGTGERLSQRLRWPLLSSTEAEERPWTRAIVLQPIGAAYLNQLTMGMLGAFRSGMVRIPGALTELLDQLGSVVAKETFYGVRVDSGVGAGVRAHDDLVLALGMALIDVERRRGARPVAFAEVNMPHLHF
jgi:hypothetical protein